MPLYVFSPRYSTTVDQWLQTQGRALAPVELVKKLLDIARQTATGLAHMHAHGVLHRDLKLNNISSATATGRRWWWGTWV
jgi:hypothetical protein